MKINKGIEKFIKANVIGKDNATLTEIVNRQFNCNFNIQQIKAFKARNHLNSGLTGQFKKGDIPFNKGKHWDDYLDHKKQIKIKNTCFKKGKNVNNQRHNWRTLADERLTKDGYVEIKVENNKWVLKQRFLWEKYHNKKLLNEDIVIFADTNKYNFNKNNLIKITRNELLQMNKLELIKNEPELTKIGLTLAKYIIKINNIKGIKNGD